MNLNELPPPPAALLAAHADRITELLGREPAALAARRGGPPGRLAGRRRRRRRHLAVQHRGGGHRCPRGQRRHAARFAPHRGAHRRGSRARHRLRVARAHRGDLARRPSGRRRRPHPHAHPHPRGARGGREPRTRGSIRSPATSTCTAPTTRSASANPAATAASGCATTTSPTSSPASPRETPLSSPEWLHFVGLAGSGMSALAVFHAGGGGRATGSDRALDRGEHPEIRDGLLRAGVTVVAQDGCGLSADCDAVVVSTAIEDSVPDIRRARELGLPILHRSELLARYVAAHRTIAVTGTSGKSTVTAMIFTILRGCGRDPRLLTGGALVDLQRDGHLGNAWGGLCGGAELAGDRGRRERRFGGALPRLGRRGPEPRARPQGDGRGRGDVRDLQGEPRGPADPRRGRQPGRPARRRRHLRRWDRARTCAPSTSTPALAAAASPWTACPSPCRRPDGTTPSTRSRRSPPAAPPACRSPRWRRRWRRSAASRDASSRWAPPAASR